MQAFQILSPNTPPVLREVPIPDPGPGEVQLRIAACGLNFADLLTIKGTYQEKPTLPHTLGMELSGTITALGTGVHGWAKGDRVALFSGGGGLAEYGVFPAERCVRLPDEMGFDVAAGFLIAYGTSHLALNHRARLAAGETVVVLGAAGGVGLTAVEIAARMGARVIACARGADKLAIAARAGAAETLDTGRPDLRAALRALGPVDVIYDAVGEPVFSDALRATRRGARVLIIGFAGGQVPQIPANYLLVKNLTVHGLYWGGYLDLDPRALTTSLETLLDWYGAGRLHPHVSHVLPLSRAAEALELLRTRTSTGKVVVRPDQVLGSTASL